jgi:hypothetical protein
MNPSNASQSTVTLPSEPARRADDAQGILRAIRPDRTTGQNAVPGPPSHVKARLRLCLPVRLERAPHRGAAFANAGHDTRALQAWLGHKNIQHTVRYTEMAPDRFKNFWR